MMDMFERVFPTKRVVDEIESKVVLNIIELLRLKEKRYTEKEVDYLQVFEGYTDKILNYQEQPKLTAEIKLSIEKPFKKLFAVRHQEKERTVWVIMFPEEY